MSDIQIAESVGVPGNTASGGEAAPQPTLGDLIKSAVADNASEAAAKAATPVQAAAEKTAVKEVVMKGVEFKLLEDAAIVTLPNGTTKTLSLADFYNMLQFAFNKTVEENGSEIQLPKNCTYIRTSSKSMYVTLYYPEGVYDLQYHAGGSRNTYKIPTPNIVVCLILDLSTNPKGKLEARVTTAKYFCTDYPVGALRIKHTTNVDHANGLYLLPFSNIYEDAKLCTGDNVMPTVMPRNDLRRLNWHFDVLWSSPFNNDLGLHALSSWEGGVQAWYQHLRDRQVGGHKFPYERLRGYRPATI